MHMYPDHRGCASRLDKGLSTHMIDASETIKVYLVPLGWCGQALEQVMADVDASRYLSRLIWQPPCLRVVRP